MNLVWITIATICFFYNRNLVEDGRRRWRQSSITSPNIRVALSQYPKDWHVILNKKCIEFHFFLTTFDTSDSNIKYWIIKNKLLLDLQKGICLKYVYNILSMVYVLFHTSLSLQYIDSHHHPRLQKC